MSYNPDFNWIEFDPIKISLRNIRICESEESCVTSQQTTDSFLSDSKPTVRTSLDDYIFLHLRV